MASQQHPFGDNCTLPSELVDRVFEYAIDGRVRPIARPSDLRIPYIGQMRLVNKAWNDYVTPFYYSSFQYHGNPSKVEHLWKFLKMVVTRPDRAAYVRQVTISTMDLFAAFQPLPHEVALMFLRMYHNQEMDQFYTPQTQAQREYVAQFGMPTAIPDIRRYLAEAWLEEDGFTIRRGCRAALRDFWHTFLFKQHEDWLTRALIAVGFDTEVNNEVNLKERALSVLSRGRDSVRYQAPLAALLLAYCPNLKEVNLHLFSSALDPWFDRILGYAVGRNSQLSRLDGRPLQNVRSLSIAPPRFHSHRPIGGAPEKPLVISEALRPFYRLPRLTQFTGLLVTCDASVAHIDPDFRSTIQCLTLNPKLLSDLHLPTWLHFTPNLRQFSLRIPGHPLPNYIAGYPGLIPSIGMPPNFIAGASKRESNGPVFYRKLWAMLLAFKDQLEYLDLYQDRIKALRPWFQHNADLPDSFCPPLAEFSRVRLLNIPLFLLAGHECSHPVPRKLRSHLPPNLESLGLYCESSLMFQKYLQASDPDYEEEFRGLILAPPAGPACPLQAITYDRDTFGPPDFSLQTQALRDHGIHVDSRGTKFLPYAGWAPPLGALLTDKEFHQYGSEYLLATICDFREPELVIPRGMVVQGEEGALADDRVLPRPEVSPADVPLPPPSPNAAAATIPLPASPWPAAVLEDAYDPSDVELVLSQPSSRSNSNSNSNSNPGSAMDTTEG